MEWFQRAPRRGWAEKEKQRQFFDHLSKKFSIRTIEDWSKITKSVITENGGRTILNSYFGGSKKFALRSLYPGSK